MNDTYEDEQEQLKIEIINLKKEVEVQKRQRKFRTVYSTSTQIHRAYRIHVIRQQRACKGGLCESIQKSQRQAQAEDIYQI